MLPNALKHSVLIFKNNASGAGGRQGAGGATTLSINNGIQYSDNEHNNIQHNDNQNVDIQQ